MIIVVMLLVMVYLLNIIDYLQTVYAIQLFGIGVEANPIGRFLFENNCAGEVKILLIPIALTIIGINIHIDRRLTFVAYFLLIFFSCLVVYNFVALSLAGAFSFSPF